MSRPTTSLLAAAVVTRTIAACSDAPTGTAAASSQIPTLAARNTGGGSGGGGGGSVLAPAFTGFKVTTRYGPYSGRDGDLHITYSVSMRTSGLAPHVHVRTADITSNYVLWDTYDTKSSDSCRNAYLPLNHTDAITLYLLDPNGVVLDPRSAAASTPAAPGVGST